MKSSTLDEREQRAMDATLEAMVAIQQMDERGPVTCNTVELAAAIHTLQGFIKQHVLMRQDDYWSDWWDASD